MGISLYRTGFFAAELCNIGVGYVNMRGSALSTWRHTKRSRDDSRKFISRSSGCKNFGSDKNLMCGKCMLKSFLHVGGEGEGEGRLRVYVRL